MNIINEELRKCYTNGCTHFPEGSCVTCRKYAKLAGVEVYPKDKDNNKEINQ